MWAAKKSKFYLMIKKPNQMHMLYTLTRKSNMFFYLITQYQQNLVNENSDVGHITRAAGSQPLEWTKLFVFISRNS